MAFKLVACSSFINTNTNLHQSHNNDISEYMGFISKDTILIRCNLLSVKIGASKNLTFPFNGISSTLTINNKGRFSGFAVCNSFYGKYTRKENKIKFENDMSTQKNCIRNNSIENIIMSTLGEINNYSIENKKLLLKKDTDLLMIYQIN